MKIRFADTEIYKGIPQELRILLESSKALGFEDKPKYTDHRVMFKDFMVREGHSYDFIYDWVMIPMSKQIA